MTGETGPTALGAQPHLSDKEAKSHRSAKLKATAGDLMSRFAVLEVDQQPDATPRCQADGTTSTPRSRHSDKRRRSSTPATSESAVTVPNKQNKVNEASPEWLYGRDEKAWWCLHWVNQPLYWALLH